MTTDRGFRFGVVAVPQGGGDRWKSAARRVEELGYSSLLMPDGLQLPSPLPSLAVAAGATTTLRVGTFVMASPLRNPRLAAWDAHSLTLLSDGRFELGIGTARPEVVDQSVEQLGLPRASAAQRLAQVEQTIDHLRRLDGDLHTPVLMAAAGPRALALAAAKADIVTFASHPLASRDDVARLAADLRRAAGARVEQIELAMNIFVVGDDVPPWVAGFLGADAATLVAHDSLAMLRGDTARIADELQRRRETLGVSYISINEAFVEQAAPVVELLAGR